MKARDMFMAASGQRRSGLRSLARTCALWSGLALGVIAALLSASDAHASRLVLLEFSGKKADALREKVAQTLEEAGHTVVLSTRKSGKLSAWQVKSIAKKEDADAVVSGRVRRIKADSWALSLKVNEGKKGRAVGKEVTFKSHWLPGLTQEFVDNGVEVLSPALEKLPGGTPAPTRKDLLAEAPEDPAASEDVSPKSLAQKSSTKKGKGSSKKRAAVDEEPASDSPAPESDEPSSSEGEASVSASLGGESSGDPEADTGADSESDGKGEDDSIVQLRARVGFVHHELEFSDDIYNRLRVQRTNMWVYQADAAAFPFDGEVGKHLGIIASYEGKFSGSVQDTDFGATYPVSFSELFAGMRARYPVDVHEIGFDLTLGSMQASVDDTNDAAYIPDLSYTLVRSSLDVNLELGPVHALASAAFRLPLGYGQISETRWFPRVGGYGFEATAGLKYPFSKKVALELSGSLRRYLLEMNSEPEDAMNGTSEVAGGAVDLYTAAYLGVSFKL